MNPIAFLLFIPAAVLFLALFIMVFSYMIAGFNLLFKGKAENSVMKVRSGKITIMNSFAWLLLVLVAAYFVFVKFLGFGTYL
jgi:hypothetical protein